MPVIIIDTRERQPWTFSEYKTRQQCLHVGDYTFEGYEDVFVIERKKNIQELLSDVSGRNRKWFKQFLVRLSKVKKTIIVVEDSADNIEAVIHHMGSSQLTKSTLYWLLTQITMKYGITLMFIGKNFRKGSDDTDLFFYHLFQELKEL